MVTFRILGRTVRDRFPGGGLFNYCFSIISVVPMNE